MKEKMMKERRDYMAIGGREQTYNKILSSVLKVLISLVIETHCLKKIMMS